MSAPETAKGESISEGQRQIVHINGGKCDPVKVLVHCMTLT